MNLYPVMLDLLDKLGVIIGGGTMPVRKACDLVEAGATRLCAEPSGKLPFGVRVVAWVEKNATPDSAQYSKTFQTIDILNIGAYRAFRIPCSIRSRRSLTANQLLSIVSEKSVGHKLFPVP